MRTIKDFPKKRTSPFARKGELVAGMSIKGDRQEERLCIAVSKKVQEQIKLTNETTEILSILLNEYRKNHFGRETMTIKRKDVMKWINSTSPQTYYYRITELLSNNLLARTEKNDVFFVNPNVFDFENTFRLLFSISKEKKEKNNE